MITSILIRRKGIAKVGIFYKEKMRKNLFLHLQKNNEP